MILLFIGGIIGIGFESYKHYNEPRKLRREFERMEREKLPRYKK